MTARGALGPWHALTTWWRQVSRGVARVVLTLLAVLSLGAGMATSAWISGPGTAPPPRAGAGEPLPGSVALGPLSIVLPAELGPWGNVEGEALVGLREAVSGGGFEVEEAWGAVAAGDLVVAVMTAAPGSHGGVEALAGPFEDDRAIDVPWKGSAPHVAGWQEGDGVHALLLAVELPDGRLAVLSLSGPSAAFEGGELEASLSTVRLSA